MSNFSPKADSADPLEDFAEWFMSQPFSLLRPPSPGVHYYGDLSGMILYRDDEFQAELFIVKPDPVERCGEHGHPDVDSMEVAISGELYFTINGKPVMSHRKAFAVADDGALANYGHIVRVQPGLSHTAFVGKEGGCFLSLQRWLNGVVPSSIGLNWNGEEHAAKFKSRYAIPEKIESY